MPSSLKSLVDERVSQGAYGTSSKYLRDLIRQYKDRLQLRSLLLAGAASEPAGEADAAYFAALRQRVQQAATPGQRD
ncbi:MAG: type II toxin-antitoxin system ParD family antitoxin [Comamonadaceae bacterium]|nr:type II toxin-antitoxin system ParD family antitoxin [Comamonadaceae bacterium]